MGNGHKIKVLLADADGRARHELGAALRKEGLEVTAVTDGLEALRCWQATPWDVVVLELYLPRLSGLEVCRRIREEELTPVIFLSALSDDEHVIRGFEAGADDYVAKPASPRQLAVRIRVAEQRRRQTEERESTQPVSIGNVLLDTESWVLRRDDAVIPLTPIEFRLLYILASNEGRVVTAERLADYAWCSGEGDASLIKMHISRLRKKLEALSDCSVTPRALPGVGYRLSVEGAQKGAPTSSTSGRRVES